MRRPAQVDLLLRAVASEEADPARAAGIRRRDLLPDGKRLRAPADRHVSEGGERRGHRRQDRPQDDARDGDKVRHTTRDRLPPLQLLQGRRRRDLRERHRARLLRRRPVAEDGHRRHGVQAILGEGVLRADLRLQQQGDRRMEHVEETGHGPADDPARPAPGEDARRRDPLSFTAIWAGSTSTRHGRTA